ncbi:MAG: ATP-dependent helicase [Patescibacteria group bacterium]|nr:ATP-dependent helicase [Patescibacteria group bacterium]
MNESPFDSAYSRLNSAQQQAVQTVEGPVMVIAGPGTGKTQILILRIANILRKTQMNPENILALTFTEAAAHEMRLRLVGLTGNDGYRVPIYTFHGFCNHVIKQNPESFDDLLSATDIAELDQLRIVQGILESQPYKYIKPTGKVLYYLKPLVSAINQLKKEGITPEELSDAVFKQQNQLESMPDLYYESGRYAGKMRGKYRAMEKSIRKNTELADVYRRYQAQLREHDVYDFNDMILKVIVQLEKQDELLLRLQEQFQYILIDEHQDTNAAQNRLVELLCSFHDNPNLFVVGDEKQAIFRFQGASLENFLYFRKRYPAATLIQLDTNYRSSQVLLDAAASLILADGTTVLFRESATLKAGNMIPNVPVSVAVLEDYYAEYYYVAEEVKKLAESGIPYAEIAVIARRNADLAPVTYVFERQGIPYTFDSDLNILEDLEIEKVLLLFRAIAEPNNDELLVRIMHFDCFGIYVMDIYRLLDEAHHLRIPFWEILERHATESPVGLRHPGPPAEFFRNLVKWNSLSHQVRFDELFITVINESGFLRSSLGKPSAFDFIGKLTSLFKDCQLNLFRNRQFSLKDFIVYLDDLAKHRLQLRSRPAVATSDAVQLMTAHKSKGREFGYVFILNVTEGRWGKSGKGHTHFTLPWDILGITQAEAEGTEDSDERRLFYVALTRAKQEVILTYSSSALDGNKQLPSRYISEINPETRRKRDTISFNHRFAKDKAVILSPKKSADLRKIFHEHTNFLVSRLEQQGLSVTALNNYLTCPWRFFFRSLIRMPEVKDASQLFGTAIHEALDRYLHERQKRKPDQVFLLTAFRKAMEAQPFRSDEFEIWLERGIKALGGYYDFVIRDWNNPVESEITITGVPVHGNLFLKGKIDMIEIVSASNEVIIHDFKTGKPKSRGEIEGSTKSSNGDYKRQLVFYKLLIDGYRNGFYIFRGAQIDFVEPTEAGTYKSEFFSITADDVKKLLDDIERLRRDISELGFIDRYCEDPDCEYCALRRYMSI